jgi:hypothetical protein
MEQRGESRIAVGGSAIAAPIKKGAVIAEMPQKNIPAVCMDGCVLWPRQGLVSTGGKISINVLLLIDADPPQGQCSPVKNSPIS